MLLLSQALRSDWGYNECLGASCLPEKELGSFLLVRWKVNFRKIRCFAILWFRLNCILGVMLKSISEVFFLNKRSLFLGLNIDQMWNLAVAAVKLLLLHFDLLSAQKCGFIALVNGSLLSLKMSPALCWVSLLKEGEDERGMRIPLFTPGVWGRSLGSRNPGMVCHPGATASHGCHLPGTTAHSVAQCSPVAKDLLCACEQRWLRESLVGFPR